MNEINNNKVNLCDSCSQVYPDCTSKPENVYFGDGIGNDNICACSKYQPSTRPQLEECPIYGGMCGYPSNLCYECPRHGGAHEKPLWWTAGLQPFAQPQRWIPVTERLPKDQTYVLVSTLDNDVQEAHLDGEGRFRDYFGDKVKCVVAWMPLPEPYKGEEE